MGSYAYSTELRIVHDREVKVEWIYDSDSGPPWAHCDGHGPVRENLQAHRNGNSNKKPGERPLNQGDRSTTQYYYDWQAAMKQARKEEWGLGIHEFMGLMCELRREPTKGQVYARAVERDFQYLRSWINDEWHYCGIGVTDVETGLHDSLWGIESNGEDYHDEVIGQLADEMWEDVLIALLTGESEPNLAAWMA